MFERLQSELKDRSHQVLMTTRNYKEVNEIIERRKLTTVSVGKHGGKSLKNKLLESVERIKGLVPIYEEFNPDLVVSFSSPEAARTAYGLAIPHLCLSDSPHAEAVMRLTLPLSKMLMTPWLIPKDAWKSYGIKSESIVRYKALDPWVWLKDFKPDSRIIDELGINTEKPLITIRLAEIFAAYLLGTHRKEDALKSIIHDIIDLNHNAQIVVLTRYKDQASALRDNYDGDVIVTMKAVDGPSLINYSDIFIGGGGTMSAEAAILGVPTISCYPGEPTLIELFLIEKGLNIRETNPKSLVERVSELLDNLNKYQMDQKERARQLINNFEDPVKFIIEEIEK
jgi:predicted glycosyltransferase